MPADDINKMSDEQLHAILDPYAPLCRPSAALTAFQPAAAVTIDPAIVAKMAKLSQSSIGSLLKR